jgi:hypothetical protein
MARITRLPCTLDGRQPSEEQLITVIVPLWPVITTAMLVHGACEGTKNEAASSIPLAVPRTISPKLRSILVEIAGRLCTGS